MQHAWKLHQMIIYFLSIHRSDKLSNLKEQPENIPQNSHTLNALTYQADCAHKRPHNLDKSSHSNSFYGCAMFIQESICPVYMVKFLYDLGFLGPWMYGYATVSYIQILNHLKF